MGWIATSWYENSADVALWIGYGDESVSRVSLGGVLQVDTWSHVVSTWDGTADGSHIHIYIAGAEVDYADTTGTAMPRSDDSTTGAFLDCDADTGFVGTIDDVRIYDHALDASEISLL